jgi:DNA ligase-1
MLASDASWEDYSRILSEEDHMLASVKLDGIRATVRNGILVSRTLKPIRNEYIQSKLGLHEYNGMDGELTVDPAYGEGVFARASSGVMSFAGQPDFTYHVFDDWQLGEEGFDYNERLKVLKNAIGVDKIEHVRMLKQTPVHSLQELEKLEQEAVSQGYEGLILRHPLSPYKTGRATLRERYMLKLKRFSDSEATIIGFQELLHNENEPQIDHLGLQRRSAHQDNKTLSGKLGALIVQDTKNPSWQFNIGTGFTDDLRHHIWQNQQDYLGKIVKYKYLEVGIKDLPRHPVYLGLRAEEDLS